MVPFLLEPSRGDVTFVALSGSGLELFRFLPPMIQKTLTAKQQHVASEKFCSNATTIVVASCGKIDGKVVFREDDGAVFSDESVEAQLRNRDVILIDSSVHSGHSMQSVADAIIRRNPASISSYTLFLKRSSSFIPNHFGIIIDDVDRALFLLNKLSNNRFIPQHIIRKLDRQKDFLSGCGIDSRTTNYLLEGEHNNRSYRGFIVETPQGKKPAGMGCYEENLSGTYTDIRGNNKEFQGENVMVVDYMWARPECCEPQISSGDYRQGLLRWAETLARSMNKRFVVVSVLGARSNPFCNLELEDSKKLEQQRQDIQWWRDEGYFKLENCRECTADNYVIKKIS